MASNLKIMRISLIASIISFYIWQINFGVPSVQSARRAPINNDVTFSIPEGKLHVLVTGGAGYIGSHAALALLEQGHAVTVLDNLSRGNYGAIDQLHQLFPHSLRFHYMDLGDKPLLESIFVESKNPIDLVIHFAAVAYVGESVAEPLRYYENITVNTVHVMEAMKAANVKNLVYSSTCAVYGNPDKLPVTEATPPKPINPYGEAKLYAENVIRNYAKADKAFKAVILRYFNVYGSDPEGRLGEYPRPELRKHSRISGACMDAALGNIPHLKVLGTQHPTPDGTCVRDYIHVTDLVAAHLAAMQHTASPPALFNVGTGKGVSVKQFVTACKVVTLKDIQVEEVTEARPGDYAEVWADVNKIQRELGWRANYTDVNVGLQHAWDWRQSHPQGYE